jgi:hypothetical protein
MRYRIMFLLALSVVALSGLMVFALAGPGSP